MSEHSPNVDQLNSSQRMLLALKEARVKIEAMERSKAEPIAIIGMSCRFPGGANDPDAFWQLLINGVDAITEVPRSRWNIDAYYDPDPDAPGKMYTRYGGFLQQVDQFDAKFFGISPREAVKMDPQQRLLLEVSWEALENAGLISNEQAASQMGVFVGITTNDYARLIMPSGDLKKIDAYYLTGNPLNAVPGRLSYTLGLQGPCMAIDTACSSSLVTIHVACQSLRNGECSHALAGGVNLILTPDNNVALSKARMLSADGRCKTFDASAEGIVRGEGCGMVVLKRLSDALADGDNISALIRGSAVNQDGYSSGFTVPNKTAQEILIRQVLAKTKVDPSEVDYIEAHGTGTSLGDPLEIRALGAVFSEGRSPEQPLKVGSVKTNIGHLESAAGIASLMKVVLSLQHETIPPHLHLKQLNPYVNWNELPISVTTQATPWPGGEKRRIAGISSFGASGINAHILVEGSEELGVKSEELRIGSKGAGEKMSFSSSTPNSSLLTPHSLLLTLSAKTQEALNQLGDRYEKHLAKNPGLSLEDICFSANTGRRHFKHRLSILASSTTELSQKLAAFNQGQETSGVIQGEVEGTTSPKIAFLFTGEGSQYVDMGRELYETQPTFRQALQQCDEILRSYLEYPLLEVLYNVTADGEKSEQQLGPNITSERRWTRLGETPSEATAAESAKLNEAVYGRSALFAVEYALFELWRSWGVEPAMVMGDGVGEYVAACVAGVFSLEDGLKLIVLEDEEIALEVIYSQPHISLVSGMTGELAMTQVATPGYWSGLPSQKAKFAAGMETLRQQGCDVFLELGPKPVLWETEVEFVCLASLNPGKEDWQQILESLATLYVSGVKIDWLGFGRDSSRRRVQLPTYPWQRNRYWLEMEDSSLEKVEGEISQNHRQTAIGNFLNEGDTEQLAQHLQAAGKLSPEELSSLPKILELLVNQHQQQLQGTSPVDVQTEPPQEPLNTDPLTPEDIQLWLVRKVAKELGVKPEDLDIRAPFDSYGLDSILAISIASAGHQFLGFEVSPILLLHYPTIELLSKHLAKKFEASGSEIFEI